jgi:Protein of unknown function (DUF3617)
MRSRIIDRATAVAILVAGLGASAVAAEIKVGKWEFTVLVPGVTQLPPGLQNQPGVQAGPKGITVRRTECTRSDHPLPSMAAPHANPLCKVDKTDVRGGTVRWSWSCTTETTTVHSEGILHYHGEALDGEYTFRTRLVGHPPVEKSQSLTGRYLGPCDSK